MEYEKISTVALKIVRIVVAEGEAATISICECVRRRPARLGQPANLGVPADHAAAASGAALSRPSVP